MARSDGEGQRQEAEDRPPTIGAVPLPSLSLLNEAATDELGAQERRADALDAKAGVLLGFAGVLVGLSVDKLKGVLAHVATGSLSWLDSWRQRRSFPGPIPPLLCATCETAT